MSHRPSVSILISLLPRPFQDFVREHSGGTRAEAEDGRIHDFRRDSSAIPDAWRGKVSSFDEDLILEIAGQEILTVYGRA